MFANRQFTRFHSKIQLFTRRLRAQRTGFTNLSSGAKSPHSNRKPRHGPAKSNSFEASERYHYTLRTIYQGWVQCGCCERCRLRLHSLPQPLSPRGYTKLATIRKHYNESRSRILRNGSLDLFFHCRDILCWKLLVLTTGMLQATFSAEHERQHFRTATRTGGDTIPNLFIRITHLSLFPFLLRICLSSGFAFKYPFYNPSKSRLHLILCILLRNRVILGSIGFALPS